MTDPRIKFTPQVRTAVIAAMADGATMATAARAAGVSPSTIHEAMRRDPGLRALVATARETGKRAIAGQRLKVSEPSVQRARKVPDSGSETVPTITRPAPLPEPRLPGELLSQALEAAVVAAKAVLETKAGIFRDVHAPGPCRVALHSSTDSAARAQAVLSLLFEVATRAGDERASTLSGRST